MYLQQQVYRKYREKDDYYSRYGILSVEDSFSGLCPMRISSTKGTGPAAFREVDSQLNVSKSLTPAPICNLVWLTKQVCKVDNVCLFHTKDSPICWCLFITSGRARGNCSGKHSKDHRDGEGAGWRELSRLSYTRRYRGWGFRLR